MFTNEKEDGRALQLPLMSFYNSMNLIKEFYFDKYVFFDVNLNVLNI